MCVYITIWEVVMSINTSIACNQPLLFNVKQYVSACNWPSSDLSFSLKRKYILGWVKEQRSLLDYHPVFFLL
jgi:hypothetical protein